jgi:hypothetical protein
LGQEDSRPIGAIDFFGYAGFNLDPIKAALPIHEKDPFPGPSEVREKIRQAVKSAIGRAPTDVAPVCCDSRGNFIIFVGLPGLTVKEPRLNPLPKGKLKLPPSIVELYDQTMEASSASVLKGNVREDASRGYALSISDSALREKQLALRAYATKHDALIRAVLKQSSETKQRIVAADLLGYTRQSTTQIAHLVRATRDTNDGVRNNATRALVVLAASSPTVAARIPARPFIEMLNSGTWSDRNKAGGLLSILTRSRDPKLLAQLRSEAVTSLIEMALWRSAGHASSARVMLGRIGGISEERISELVNADNPEAIINTVQLKR